MLAFDWPGEIIIFLPWGSLIKIDVSETVLFNIATKKLEVWGKMWNSAVITWSEVKFLSKTFCLNVSPLKIVFRNGNYYIKHCRDDITKILLDNIQDEADEDDDSAWSSREAEAGGPGCTVSGGRRKKYITKRWLVL